MRCIQLDFMDTGTLAPVAFGYQLRAGYMLSDVLNCAGNSSFLIKFKSAFDKFSIIQKVMIVKNAKTTEPDIIEVIDEFLKTYQSFNSMKHPPNNIFLSYKSYERSMLTFINEWRDQFVVAAETAGLGGFLSICKKDVFDIFDLKTTEKVQTTYHLKAMDVIAGKAPTNAAKQSVFLLPHSFYEFHLAHTNVETDIEAINNDNQYLVKAFSMPNISTLSITELESIKKQFTTQLQTFKTAIYEWSKSCYLNNHSEKFVTEVVPTFSTTEQVINDNDILKHCKSVHHNKVVQSIYFGAVEPENIWLFYLHYNVITIEEFGYLKTAYAADAAYKIPIMLFLFGNNLAEAITQETTKNMEEDETVNGEIKRVKKHINIDD